MELAYQQIDHRFETYTGRPGGTPAMGPSSPPVRQTVPDPQEDEPYMPTMGTVGAGAGLNMRTVERQVLALTVTLTLTLTLY